MTGKELIDYIQDHVMTCINYHDIHTYMPFVGFYIIGFISALFLKKSLYSLFLIGLGGCLALYLAEYTHIIAVDYHALNQTLQSYPEFIHSFKALIIMYMPYAIAVGLGVVSVFVVM
jgi:uncharacterized membrane protein (Fun14 family)